jgi:hypothetical protein
MRALRDLRPAESDPFVASAALVEPLEDEPSPEPPGDVDARRALALGVVGVLGLGVVTGPLAIALGQRAELEDLDASAARRARAGIALGRAGLALHLAFAAALLPWLMFVMPFVLGE